MTYRSCDIRGVIGAELTPEFYTYCGLALASFLEKDAKFLVSRDPRISSGPFLAALIHGLQLGGMSVVNLGLLPPAITYYATRRVGADGFAIVSGFGAPETYNGLRWLLPLKPFVAEKHVQALRSKIEQLQSERPEIPEMEFPPVRNLDVTYDYVGWLQDTWFDSPQRSLRIAVDPMFGSWAFKARRYIQAIFPHTFTTAIHDKPLGTPKSSNNRTELLADICREVDFQKAEIGFVLEDDGERLCIIDRNGVPLRWEELTWLLLESIGDSLKNETFVHDGFCSRVILREMQKKYRVNLVRSRNGTTFFFEQMRKNKAIFGAEACGRYFFRAIRGGTDPMFTICWIIDYLARTGIDLVQWRTTLPELFITPIADISFSTPGIGSPDRFLDILAEQWSDYPIDRFDGIRIELPEGWLVARKSLSKQTFTFRLEGNDTKTRSDLIARCCCSLSQFGDVSQTLWRKWTD